MDRRGNLQILLWAAILLCASVLACRWWVVAQRVPLDLQEVQAAVGSHPGPARQVPAPPPPATQAPQAGVVDINSADRAQLESLPGIGAVLAGRIIESREQQGPFVSVDDLLRVAGIGEKKLDQLRPLVTAGGRDG